jgi:hypothetical protein
MFVSATRMRIAALLAEGLSVAEVARRLNLAYTTVNGDRVDNGLENLTLLCPNCHSQTDTWAGRNPRRGLTGSDAAPGDALAA